MSFPTDIFTEQDADPDTLSNLGPLRRLAGIWESRVGVDINPKEDGPERRDFSERIELQPIDAQSNGPQLFYGLRYHTHILATDEDATFHDQTGYWLWEPATGLVLQTLSIPRGQVAIAAGQATPDATELVLTRGAATPVTASVRRRFSSTPSAPTPTASKSSSIPTAAGATCSTPC